MLDRLGYHALSCRTGGSLGVRHNALREVFLHYCKLAKIEAEREAPAGVLLPKQIFSYSASMPTCLDCAVTHTQQPLSLECASVTTGAAGRYEESVKAPRYMEECKENGLNFIPMVVEVFGAWGFKSAPVFSFVSRAVALHQNLDEERSDSYLRQALSVTLQRYNANTLLKHRNPLTPTADGPRAGPGFAVSLKFGPYLTFSQ